MLSYENSQIMLLVLSYMLIYNLTSFLLFATVLQASMTKLQTLYSFSSLGGSSFYSKIISLCVLSMAGVPPLLGFFSKIFVFVLVSSSNLFLLFPPLFILLFVGLYFYIQNMRFLNTSSPSNLVLTLELEIRSNDSYYLIALPIAFLTIFGFFYVDDLLLIASWLLI